MRGKPPTWDWRLGLSDINYPPTPCTFCSKPTSKQFGKSKLKYLYLLNQNREESLYHMYSTITIILPWLFLNFMWSMLRDTLGRCISFINGCIWMISIQLFRVVLHKAKFRHMSICLSVFTKCIRRYSHVEEFHPFPWGKWLTQAHYIKVEVSYSIAWVFYRVHVLKPVLYSSTNPVQT